jgi:hypothetical protein
MTLDPRTVARARRRATRGPNVASSAPPEAHIRDQETTSLELTDLRRFGGKDASAALRAQIGEKPPADCIFRPVSRLSPGERDLADRQGRQSDGRHHGGAGRGNSNHGPRQRSVSSSR